ncbi:immunity 42 family protein [Paraburkholderia bonniea]|uniref:immunity 42 family protein n=1 Tax=Paraburkholderia bonniea TaxID=2152891 RepID=UPI001291B7A5|nr:immunity 42 family protein [Paraburkholderia bonniea]WJF91535.1 immunity 42 family protein [Paraburkholderia bonniea]WJF94854.1 immunity 42 family protein [Paraburkholderia bonniea]
MLIGNPDAFAIWCDAVDSWSTNDFKNGCFAYFIGGEIILSLNATLNVDLNLLSALFCIKETVDDERIFQLNASSAYTELIEQAFPATNSDAEFSDFKHLVSVGSLLDDGHLVFLIESGEQAKMIYGRGDDLSTIREIALGLGEFQTVIKTATRTWKTP